MLVRQIFGVLNLFCIRVESFGNLFYEVCRSLVYSLLLSMMGECL